MRDITDKLLAIDDTVVYLKGKNSNASLAIGKIKKFYRNRYGEEESMKFLEEDATSTYLEEIENSGNSEEDIDFELDDYSARLSSCNDEYVWTWQIIAKNNLRNS